MPYPTPDSVADSDGETLESIPWDALRSIERSPARRVWFLASGAAAVLVALVAVVGGLGSGGEAIPVTVPPVTTPPATVVSTTSTTIGAVTEADLMAVDVLALERSAAAVAEIAAHQYYAADSGDVWAGVEFDRSRETFVEYARAVSTTPLDRRRFEVVVAVSVLDAEPGAPFVRRSPRAITLVVEWQDGLFHPVSLPAIADLPVGPVMSVVGEPVSDEAGIGWPMATDPRVGVPVSRTAP